jgi:hypothetical protein
MVMEQNGILDRHSKKAQMNGLMKLLHCNMLCMFILTDSITNKNNDIELQTDSKISKTTE